MAPHWTALFWFPCFIGFYRTMELAYQQIVARFRKKDPLTELLDGLTEEEKVELGLPPPWVMYPWQFVWSSVTTFPSCLVVGGIKLLFF